MTRKNFTYFTKEEDEYIINHIYTETCHAIALHLNRCPVAINSRVNIQFGRFPTCEKHTRRAIKCTKCKKNLREWRKQALQMIQNKKYTDTYQTMHTKEIYQYIVTHIYKDKTFTQIEETFTLTHGIINANLKKIFGELPKCDHHMRFIRKCNACDKKLAEWKENAQKIIDSTDFASHVEYSERISTIKENAKQKKIEEQLEQKHLALPKEIYEKTMEILLQNSFCGNQLRDMFEQISRYYIIEFFIAYEFKEKNSFSFPFPLLEYFFSIPPNLNIIKKISKMLPYKQMTVQLLYTLKDIHALYTITKNETISSLFKILLAMHTKLFYTIRALEGITAALLYMISIEQKMPISQHKLANIFNATEMTIRSRMKQMKILLENEDVEVMEYFNALKKFEFNLFN